MRTVRLAAVSAWMLVLASFSSGCRDSTPASLVPDSAASVAAISIAPANSNLLVGKTSQLVATPRDAAGRELTGRTVSWTSSAPNVASVSASGTVTGLAPAAATISATIDGHSASAAVSVSLPAQGLTFANLSAGDAQACGLSSFGAVYCWGWNVGGGLGDGTPRSTSTIRSAPVAVVGGYAFAAVSANSEVSCALTAVGSPYCWGTAGAVGNGIVAPNPGGPDATGPVALTGGVAFNRIVTNAQAACALTTAGKTYCWGYSSSAGELGDGSSSTEDVPSPTAVLADMTFSSLSLAAHHACGLTAAGAAYCWGADSAGELGDGSASSVHRTPVAVTGGIIFDNISASTAFTCGLSTSSAAYCWGDDTFGQLGNGSATSANVQLTPGPVLGGLTLVALVTGDRHVCGLGPGGTAYCWGDNSHGQLGDGTTTARTSPVAVAGGLRFSAIAAGSSFTCGMTGLGVAYCWGDNTYGEIGDGSQQNRLTPTPVQGPTGLTASSGATARSGARTGTGAK